MHVFSTLSLLTLAYIALGLISVLFEISGGNAASLWPSAGLAVAVCLVYGRHVWPAVLVGSVIVNASTTLTLGTALLVGIGDVLEVLLTVSLIQHYTDTRTRFQRSADVFRFVVFAIVGSLAGAVIGTTSLLAGGFISAATYVWTWSGWWLSDLTGMIIVAPAVLTMYSSPKGYWNRQKLAELGLFAAILSACALIVFALGKMPLLFLFLPFVVWLALRFSQAEVAKMNVIMVTAGLASIFFGTGVLATLPPEYALTILKVFVTVTGVTGLALAVTAEERLEAVIRLRRIRGKLERLVERRTRQLKNVVNELRHDIARREAIQEELVKKGRQLEEAQRLAHLGSWEWDAVHDHMIMSREMLRIYGVPPEAQHSLNYRKYLEYIPPDECSLVDAVVASALESKATFSYEHHVVRPDGTVRFLNCRGEPEFDDYGRPVRLLGTAHDRTEEKALQDKLLAAEELYRKLVELSPDAIYLLDEGRCVFSNAAGLHLLGAADADLLKDSFFLDFVTPEFREELQHDLVELRRDEKLTYIEAPLTRLDGSLIDIELSATSFSNKGKQHILLVVRDISERKKAEREIHHLAHHDLLTGLGNRALFKERLEHALAQSHRLAKPLVVMFVDLDRFKNINDTAGHNAGDQVLREVTLRLRSCLRDSDTIARAGGDEFLILIETMAEPRNVPAIAQKILSAIRHPFYVDGKEFEISASIGISTYPDDGQDVSTLIKHADIAMYKAKMAGKARFCYYSAAMARQSLERHAMESALRHAIERGEMELYYQPKVCLSTCRLCGAEALIRWNHPEHGVLLPYRFVSLAEEMGLIADLGLWAIHEVCRRHQAWHEQGLAGVRVAVNLAYSQFADKQFFEKTAGLLHEYGLEPGFLELEITETMVMENAERLMGTLQRLKKLGVHLSVDDFGTGYSSLAYLKRLPVDSVKVDRSFIKDLPSDSEDAAITHAVLALVHSLKRSVVAEGVETREQLQFLMKNGCDEVQGFYFSPAVREAEFRHFLSDEKCFEPQMASAV